MNYIQTFDVQIPNITQAATLILSTPTSSAVQTIQYFDGLGRPAQTVQKAITPLGYDMVKPIVYNKVGLDETNYDPYPVLATSTGNFQSGFATDQPNYYNTIFSDNNGKSPSDFEKSPLNRVLRQGASGDAWQLDPGDHPISFSYLSNTSGNTKLTATLWKATGNTCTNAGNYADNQLYVTLTTSEDGAETYEFKDKQGHVVLKRSVLDESTYADTYYVYDYFGLLRFVISPEGVKQLSSENKTSFVPADPTAKKFVYFYTYDERNRLIEKQIPGKDPEYYVYNKNDKVILYQDGNMRKTSAGSPVYEWMFTKYDAFGRVIMTGITKAFPSQTRYAMQTLANGNTYNWEFVSYSGTAPAQYNNYYTNQSFPTLSTADYTNLLTINYYDSYTMYNNASTAAIPLLRNAALAFALPSASYPAYLPELKYVSGKPTVSYLACNSTLLATAAYYDIYGRAIQTAAEHHLTGYDRFTSHYKGLTANVDTLQHMHYSFKTGSTYTYTRSEKTIYSYDNAGRQTNMEYTYNGNTTKHITGNTYNELGKLIKKQIKEGTTTLQTVDYLYNIRGWLSKINDPSAVTSTGDLFGEELFYEKLNPLSPQNTLMFNGNITAVNWQTAQPTGITTPVTTGVKGYFYFYDKFNRLLKGMTTTYSEFADVSAYISGAKPYDLNGNILYMRRYGLRAPNNTANTIDELKYTYDGNQLIAVDDAVSTDNGGDFMDNGQYYSAPAHTIEYTYDKNGNLTADNNKGIVSITYNYLNLPVSIAKTGFMRLEYLYDAAGAKRQQKQYTTSQSTPDKTTDFIANFVYENNVPAYNTYDEGRIVYNANGTYFAEVYIKDHLGNTRVTCRLESGVLKTRQVDSYYPFGMNIKGLSANSTDTYKPNEYLYNGKMMQDEMGLNLLDYGARFYDAVLGRFHSQDSYAEKYLDLNPYQYGANNPILYLDVNGDSISVAEQYRTQFNGALESAFGENASKFSYNSSGKLVTSATKKDFKGDQRKAFKSLSKVMGQETTTNVVYEQTLDVTLNDGSNFTIDTRQHGGGATLTVFDSKGLSNENYIVVDPNASKTFSVDAVGPAYFNGTTPSVTNFWAHPATVNSSAANTTWHELGHVIYQGKSQDNVINFDNMTRGIYQSTLIVPTSAPGYDKGASGYTRNTYQSSPMSPRPMDISHNRLIK